MLLWLNVVQETNLEIAKTLDHNASTLSDFQDSFFRQVVSQRPGREFHVVFFSEQLPLPGIGLVVTGGQAAYRGCSRVSIRGDHVQMVKFKGKGDPSFSAFSTKLQRIVDAISIPEQRRANSNTRPNTSRGYCR